MVWECGPNSIGRVPTQEGLEHWRAAARASERGIILMACHFGSPDLNVALVGSLSAQGPNFCLYLSKAE
ncbi:hypothetical protein [Teredinibacter purpureus]|uniref:hypothetical protein n=1 Tax=Teredinibacter purpureus TaxID=2731756 RepID=UPI00399D5A6D